MRKFIAVVVCTIFLSTFPAHADDEMKPGSIHLSLLKSINKSDYAGLAKVTLQQAIETALKVTTGKAVEAELEEEDGFLVYSVKIVNEEKVYTEFKIDAGNLSVLEQETKKHFWD